MTVVATGNPTDPNITFEGKYFVAELEYDRVQAYRTDIRIRRQRTFLYSASVLALLQRLDHKHTPRCTGAPSLPASEDTQAPAPGMLKQPPEHLRIRD